MTRILAIIETPTVFGGLGQPSFVVVPTPSTGFCLMYGPNKLQIPFCGTLEIYDSLV